MDDLKQDSESVINAESSVLSQEEIKRHIEQSQKRVLFLLDELRGMFSPHMKMTLIVRDPEDKRNLPHTLLTDDTDLEGLVTYMKNSYKEMKPISSGNTGKA